MGIVSELETQKKVLFENDFSPFFRHFKTRKN